MSQIFTGARAVIKIKDSVVGFASGINVTVEDTLTDVDVLGQLEVGDLAETAHKCNFTVNYFKPLDDGESLESSIKAPSKTAKVTSAAVLGIDTSFSDNGSGDVSADHDMRKMRTQSYFKCEIYDDITGRIIFVMENCKYQGGSGQVDARGVWTGSFSFKAMRGYGV